ncbi:MAG: hypothetical protein PHX86_03025 [Caldisericia bacterium]|nr:hypothetical protein [Caldisericia bacterium]
MFKTWIPNIIIFCIVSVLVVGFFYPYAKPTPKGIYYDNEKSQIVIDGDSNASPSLSVFFPTDYRCSHISLVKDSIIPNEEKGVIEETSIQMELHVPNESIPVSANTIVRTFRNGDLFVLVRLFSVQSVSQPIQCTLQADTVFSESAKVWSLQYNTEERPHESVVPDSEFISYALSSGMNILPPSLYYIETKKESFYLDSILAGAPSVYQKAPTECSDLTTLVRMNSQPVVDWSPKDSISITSALTLESYQTAESWFFISKSSLLDLTNEETYENMRSADFTLRKKVTKDGIFHIASEDQYVGASNQRYDYYYTYAGWEGRRFMNLHQKYPSQRFFYDMFANTVYTVAKAASKYGNWPSGHASVYLWNLYQFPKNYIDTRYCTDAGFFLLKTYNDYQMPEALFTGKKIGDYLVDLAKKDQKIETSRGFFFYDYYHKDYPETPTHSSLNHILSEINYLFELYLATHNEEYLTTAEQILSAIEDTESRWIRKDSTENYRWYHDLWYCVVPAKDGSLDFKYHDYTKDLTYKDLLKTQYLLQSIYNRSNPSIENLIRHKLEFLRKEGYDVEKIHQDFTDNYAR